MHTVTALSNLGSVQVRINDIVASKEDLLSLDMKAVKQVDYIDNPGVRYGEGIAYVVNIIVKRPVSGYDRLYQSIFLSPFMVASIAFSTLRMTIAIPIRHLMAVPAQKPTSESGR